MATYNVAIQFFIIVDPQGVNMLKHVLNTESEIQPTQILLVGVFR